jgi:L-threonylcarbamoyladenylate synthase
VGKYYIIRAHSASGLLRLSDVHELATGLLGGSLAVLPTETGHMVAALATSPHAVLRAFAFKGRPLSNPMHVACSSLTMADKYSLLSADARKLLGTHTPGPLTVVVPQKSSLPEDLVTLNGTVGIRIPDHPATLQVIEAVGAPLTATSLNRTGEESLPVSEESLADFDWPDGDTPVVIDNEAIRHQAASTLVRFDEGGFTILRDGPVDKAVIVETLRACEIADVRCGP